MFRKIMIALLVLLQIAVPVGMAAYRPADEDVIRENGTRYVLLLEDYFSFWTTGTVFISSPWLSSSDAYETTGRYAVISTDENGYACVASYTRERPDGDAYLLHTEVERIGTYFQLDVPPGFTDAARKNFRQNYYNSYDDFAAYDFERTQNSPTLGVELFVYRGHAALGGLLVGGKTAEEFIAENQ